jgi:hypothetical protein
LILTRLELDLARRESNRSSREGGGRGKEGKVVVGDSVPAGELVRGEVGIEAGFGASNNNCAVSVTD